MMKQPLPFRCLLVMAVFPAFFAGCGNRSQNAQEAAIPPGMTRYVGTRPEFVGQHPRFTDHDQFYFEVDDDNPDSWNQIVVTYTKGMKIPNQEGRRIELIGRNTWIDFGGEGKNSYANNILHLHSWNYLD